MWVGVCTPLSVMWVGVRTPLSVVACVCDAVVWGAVWGMCARRVCVVGDAVFVWCVCGRGCAVEGDVHAVCVCGVCVVCV